MDIQTRPTGSWVVTNDDTTHVKLFVQKHKALEYASVNKYQVGFYFHNSIWDKFDRTLLGKTNLTLLYAERARQLRDKYKYLVLHYSGGSDSHNILYTFLTNNIKLDEVTIRWPKHWIDGKFYNINNKDTSAKNAPSEFNYTIQPTLKYLQQYHPEIKINIVDFTENLHSLTTENNIQNRILQMNATRNALGSIIQRLDINVDRKMASTNINNIGHIFGIEKPALFVQDNNLYFYFTDIAFESTLMEEGMNAEPFYWTSDLPLLTMEQIYQAGLYFKHNKQHLHLLNSPNKQVNQIFNDINIQQNLLKSVLYNHSWDFNKFQVDKPNIDRSDWYSWAHESSELSTLNTIYNNVMCDLTNKIDHRFLINTDKTPLFASRRTKLFHLMPLDS